MLLLGTTGKQSAFLLTAGERRKIQFQQESPVQDAHNGRKIAVKAGNLNLGFITVSNKPTNKREVNKRHAERRDEIGAGMVADRLSVGC